jgi:hypothetical protein
MTDFLGAKVKRKTGLFSHKKRRLAAAAWGNFAACQSMLRA